MRFAAASRWTRRAGGYDFVLICTKSFDSAVAAEDLAEHEDCIGEGGQARALPERLGQRRGLL